MRSNRSGRSPLAHVKKGEKLYLDNTIEKLAKAEQREALESDEREGLVREYLDTLLPEDWDNMDLFERRNFLNGSEFGGENRTGSKKREAVSNMEIWCECFGKERANLRRVDANDISAIIARIGGWERSKISAHPALWTTVGLCSKVHLFQ